MPENSVKNFFGNVGKFIKRIAKIVWEYLKVAKMEWILMVSLFALDLITKSVVQHTVSPSSPVVLIPNFLQICYTTNDGAAYGSDWVAKILGSKMASRIFYSVFAVAASVAMVLILIRNKGKSKVFRIGIAMFVAGAMGNCIDRMFIGYVRDFVHFTFQQYIFNIADAELVFGVVLIVVYFIFLYKDSGKKSEEPAPLGDVLGEIEPVDMAEAAKSETASESSQSVEPAAASDTEIEAPTDGQAQAEGSDTEQTTEQVNTDTDPNDGGGA